MQAEDDQVDCKDGRGLAVCHAARMGGSALIRSSGAVSAIASRQGLVVQQVSGSMRFRNLASEMLIYLPGEFARIR